MVRVRISSDDAGMIAMTPVVAQDLEMRELVDVILASTGKDPERILELLKRGSTVHGLSRYRWQGLELTPEELAAILATFPDPDPSVRFHAEQCTQLTLIGHALRIPIPKEAAAKKRFLKRESFWSRLLGSSTEPEYSGYSYRDKVDLFRMPVSPAAVREAAQLLTYSTLVRQLTAAQIESIELWVPRV